MSDWALLDEQDAQRSAERAASSDYGRFDLVCGSFDCMCCHNALMGKHYHVRMLEVNDTAGGLATQSTSLDRIELALCLCQVCATDIVNLVQSYVGA